MAEGRHRRPPVDASELADWWMGLAAAEAEAAVGKTLEYGGRGNAQDLIDIGRDLARLAGRQVTEAEAIELGIYFYIRGKVGRWTAAITDGRPVTDDTLHDLGVYVRMVQRVRQTGGWPGVD